MSPHQMFYHGRKGQFQRHNILISDGFQVLSTRKCRKRGPGGFCFTQMSIYQSYFLCHIFLLHNLFRTCFDVDWAKIIQLQDGWIAQPVPGCHSVLLHIWQGPPSICRAWHHWKYGKHHTEQVRVAILFLLPEIGAENWCAFHTFNIFTPLHFYILTSSTNFFCKFAVWEWVGATLNTLRSYWAAYDNWRLTQRWNEWRRWGWMYDDFDVWPKLQETFLRMIISTFWRRKFRSRERHPSKIISLLDLLDNFCTSFDLVCPSLSILMTGQQWIKLL